MDIKKISLMTVLEWTAITAGIAVSTLSMVFYGGCWTFVGLLIGAFWITLAIQDFKMHQRTEQENRELREFTAKHLCIGDSTCQYNARSSHLRCGVNPSGPCEGCRDYKKGERDSYYYY